LRERDGLTKQFEDKEINICHLGRNKFDPRTLFDIFKIIRKEKINIIHAHGYGSANFGRLIKLFNKVPVIVHAHDDDRNYPLPQKIADYLLRNLTDQAIAISDAVKASCVKKRNIPEEKVIVLLNGIPLNDFVVPDESRIEKARKQLGIRQESNVIGTIARLRKEKGVKYLIQSAVKISDAFPDAVFLIAGDGPLRNELVDLTKKLGLETKVVFAGFCEDIQSIFSIINIVAVPSISEGLGIAILEAMAMSKPIVATNVGGIIEILKDGETGLLVPPKDPNILADKIIYLINNKNEARRLGLNAKEESKIHDNIAHVQKLGQIYYELIEKFNKKAF
jgi:glycosyltransferase involved in cell wall biosynthesis